MSTCARCGANFSCAMVAGEETAAAAPLAGLIAKVDDSVNVVSASVSTPASAAANRCWCTYLPAAVPLPSEPGGACWCPSCLQAHIAAVAGLRNDAK